MPEKDQIAAQLPQFRMKNMKFQSELAAESHVCEKTIRSLEKANANPRLKTLKSYTVSLPIWPLFCSFETWHPADSATFLVSSLSPTICR